MWRRLSSPGRSGRSTSRQSERCDPMMKQRRNYELQWELNSTYLPGPGSPCHRVTVAANVEWSAKGAQTVDDLLDLLVMIAGTADDDVLRTGDYKFVYPFCEP